MQLLSLALIPETLKLKKKTYDGNILLSKHRCEQ